MKLEKITNALRVDAAVTPSRWYEDSCGAALALDLAGERWSFIILRELMFGPRRFGQLRASLSGISANILTQRLGRLEAEGLLVRRTLPAPAAVQVYELTPWGYEAEPVLLAMCSWSLRSPRHDPSLPLTPVGMMLSLKALQQRPLPRRWRLACIMAGDAFVVEGEGTELTITRGESVDVDATLVADTMAMKMLFYGKMPLEVLQSKGDVSFAGDAAALVQFVDCFALPTKVLPA